jgi:hypothetical protein
VIGLVSANKAVRNKMKKRNKRKPIKLKRKIHGPILTKKGEGEEGLKNKINPDVPFLESSTGDQIKNLDQGHEPYGI